MELIFKSSDEAFREEVRNFLKENPPESFPTQEEDEGYGMGAWSVEFYRKLAEKGWISRSWPREYGGEERPIAEYIAMIEEFAYAQAPALIVLMSDSMARSIMGRGNDFLKREFLPRIKEGSVTFWLGLSEPDAGSDLLALKTEARKDGDYYIINGQKTWSSRAHISDYCYLITRTNSNVPRHRGLSAFLVDKKLPGVSVVPMNNLEGLLHHNEVFLDNVRVHKDYLLGEEDKGFYHMLEGLEFDRFWGRVGKAPLCRGILDQLARYVRETTPPVSKTLEHKLAESLVEVEACRVIFSRSAKMIEEGKLLTTEGSLAKVLADEMGQRLFSLGLEVMGLYPAVGEDPKWQSLRKKLIHWCQFGIGHTLAGGTSEIIRNTIATRALGMPRG